MNFQDIFSPIKNFFSSTSQEKASDLELDDILDTLLSVDESFDDLKKIELSKDEIISTLINIQDALNLDEESSALSAQVDNISSKEIMDHVVSDLTKAQACVNTAILSLDKNNFNKSKDFINKAINYVESAGLRIRKDSVEFDDFNMALAARLDGLVALADSLDEKGMIKEASVIDELLLTINSNKQFKQTFKKAQEEEIEKLRKKYRSEASEVKTATPEYVEDARKAIDDKVKTYKPLEAPLSTRYSPDMPGVSMMRVADGVYQCPITKKVYDFRSGFTTAKGNKVPGGDVSLQSDMIEYDNPASTVFSTRNDVLNSTN